MFGVLLSTVPVFLKKLYNVSSFERGHVGNGDIFPGTVLTRSISITVDNRVLLLTAPSPSSLNRYITDGRLKGVDVDSLHLVHFTDT